MLVKSLEINCHIWENKWEFYSVCHEWNSDNKRKLSLLFSPLITVSLHIAPLSTNLLGSVHVKRYFTTCLCSLLTLRILGKLIMPFNRVECNGEKKPLLLYVMHYTSVFFLLPEISFKSLSLMDCAEFVAG